MQPAALRETVERLPAPRVRRFDPTGMAAVDTLVEDALTAAGWAVTRRPFVVRDTWAWADAYDRSRVEPVAALHGTNVVAVKEGATRDALVVVAHHDTVPGTGGADDNGSGVAALLALADLLAPARLHRSVLLAAVDLEELGFLGARRLVADLAGDRRVVGALVYEMLAYTATRPRTQRLPPGIGAVYRGQVRRIRERGLRGDFTAVVYQQSSTTLATCFAESLAYVADPATPLLLRAPTDLPLLGSILARAVPFTRDFARSDHVAFWEAGLPAVQVTDTANFRNPHYHEPTDIPDTLDYVRLADIVAATAVTVERLAGTR